MNHGFWSNFSLNEVGQHLPIRRSFAFGVILLAALLAFEVFNYSTTEFALSDLLGDLEFAGVRWATILAIAFCGIDFAGIARLFTPNESAEPPAEVWYLFGAWLLAATMNAMLTWWGVSIAILEHQSLGSAVVKRETLLRVVPIFVAVLVWLIRVLIIGTFSVAGERLFTQSEPHPAAQRQPAILRPISAPTRAPLHRTASVTTRSNRPDEDAEEDAPPTRPEPTYHPVTMHARSNSSHRPPLTRQ
ncbi:MAG: hypothetical protein RML93_08535 [Anaerolineales bacterium]|nr:hypothetical protein [Anaerolineales bacterium]MCS7248471.1 hypothetical protein [Anaerolineales bacterium]MDW8162284.1 hypothetical protein [Anaerolineales bacterium]MDW8447323.1 hypothetical protein [Anaerolineales bacterium]